MATTTTTSVSSASSSTSNTTSTANTTSSTTTAMSDLNSYETGSSSTAKTNTFLALVKVYVAGILMPTLAVSVSSQFGSVPTARITLPADPRLFNVGSRDRVPVQIFVKETVAESPNYVLLFEGFITGRSYVSITNQREVNFECISYISFFEDVKFRFMTSLEDIALNSVPGANDVGINVPIMPFTFPACLFYKGMMLGGNTPEEKAITMPTEYLANIIQFIEEAGQEGLRPANDYHNSLVSKYFSTLAFNLHLDRRFCWLPYFDTEVTDDDADSEDGSDSQSYQSCREAAGVEAGQAAMFPVLYGMQTSMALANLTGQVTRSSNEMCAADWLKFLLDDIEYEFLVIPAPAYHAKANKDTDEGADADEGREHVVAFTDQQPLEKVPEEEYNNLLSSESDKKESLEAKYSSERKCSRMVNFCLKPLLDDAMPPQCNVIFRSQVYEIRTNTNFYRSPTRVRSVGINDQITKLAGASGQSTGGGFLGAWAITEYYPSELYNQPKDFQYNGAANEMLEIEYHTGPWIHQDRVPPWYSYMMAGLQTVGADEGTEEDCKSQRERYLRRQLLRAQIMPRQLNASLAFTPYITCGFPGIIFDSADAGFAFAGNIIGVQHVISADSMTTTVTMNSARLLSEAALAEENNGAGYPNPINSVHVVTHNQKRMTKVYQQILGTPDTETEGAKAITYTKALETYGGPITSTTTSPQNNIYEAYKFQRRNIITFKDYCSFMDITATPSGTEEEGQFATKLSSEFINDRAKIKVFQSVPLEEVVRPVQITQSALDSENKEIAKLEAEIKELQEQIETEKKQITTLEKQIETAKTSTTSTTSSSSSSTSGSTSTSSTTSGTVVYNGKTMSVSAAESELSTMKKSVSNNESKLTSLQSQLSAKQSSASNLQSKVNSQKTSKDPFVVHGSEVDVQTVLTEIQEEASAQNIY